MTATLSRRAAASPEGKSWKTAESKKVSLSKNQAGAPQ
jgi:hypothetical protein